MMKLNHLALAATCLLLTSFAAADDIVFLAADAPNRAEESLRAFIEAELRDTPEFDCELIAPDESGRLIGTESLEDAELLVVFADEFKLSPAERAAIDRYVSSGRPVIGLRSACHAFEGFGEFNQGCMGANYLGRWEEHGPPDLRVAAGAKAHPLLAGLDLSELSANAPLYRVLPLAPMATPLLMGGVPGVREPEPVAWTSGFRGASIFVTTLGSPTDFRQPAFQTLLRRAVFWTLGHHNLSGGDPVPTLDETNSASLFDGQSLEGWTTRGGRYDGDARWNVEDGAIVGRQNTNKAGGLIYTESPYKNFIISFDTWIDYPFDSGVFLHMVPRDVGGKGIQVTLDYRPGGEIGGLYADGFLKHNPDSTDLLKREAWNQVVVRCKGDDARVTAWLNGKLLVDHELPQGSKGFAETGLVGLQVHGGENVPDTQRAMFKNIRLRELPDYDAAIYTCDDRGILSLTKAGAKAGWASMFNGRNLNGWDPRPSPKSYRVEDGVLVLPVAGGSGEIRSRKKYRDFELRLDFKIARMANSGLFLRAAPEGNPAYSGCEVQILDDFNWEEGTNSTLQPYQLTGGLYGAVPPAVPDALRPLGEWNTYHVRYVGSRIAVRLNGHLLYDVDTFEVEAKPPFKERAESGFIGMQRHGIPDTEDEDFAWFRNIYVRKISKGR